MAQETTGPRELPSDPDLAIRALYDTHWARLVRLAWLLLRDQSVAEDIVQDAFVATHRRWSSIRDTGRAVAYLQTAVVNGVRSHQRHAVVVDRELVRESGAADAPGRASLDSAESLALAAHDRERVMAVLATLPPRQREVLVLRYYSDLTEAQISTALDIAPGTVKAHAHRGLRALREALAPPRPDAAPNDPSPLDDPDVEQA